MNKPELKDINDNFCHVINVEKLDTKSLKDLMGMLVPLVGTSIADIRILKYHLESLGIGVSLKTYEPYDYDLYERIKNCIESMVESDDKPLSLF